MSTKRKEMQNLIRYYKEETGKSEVDMRDVAKFAMSRGWKLPKPKDPLDRLAADFSRAARDEIEYDPSTGRPYRVNHALPVTHGNETFFVWIDIKTATRSKMHRSLIMRRDQMLGDGVQLTFDAYYWNSIHPEEEPIDIPMDFTEDIEERLNAPTKKAS